MVILRLWILRHCLLAWSHAMGNSSAVALIWNETRRVDVQYSLNSCNLTSISNWKQGLTVESAGLLSWQPWLPALPIIIEDNNSLQLTWQSESELWITALYEVPHIKMWRGKLREVTWCPLFLHPGHGRTGKRRVLGSWCHVFFFYS